MRTRRGIIRNHRQSKQMSILLIVVALVVLTGFTNECAAQSGKKLALDQAGQWINPASLKTNRDRAWIRFAITLKMKRDLKWEAKESIQ